MIFLPDIVGERVCAGQSCRTNCHAEKPTEEFFCLSCNDACDVTNKGGSDWSLLHWARRPVLCVLALNLLFSFLQAAQMGRKLNLSPAYSMLSLRTWYRLLTQQHLLGVGGESGKRLSWTHQGDCSGCLWGGGGKGEWCSELISIHLDCWERS